MPGKATRVSVTATGSFNLDDDMFDDDEEELEADFTLDAQRFAKALDAISNSDYGRAEKRAAILELANKYYELAETNLADARETRRRSSRGLKRSFEDEDSQDSMDLDEAVDVVPEAELRALELEVQTWDFLRRLLPLRYPERQIVQPKRREPSKFQSSTELWEDFLQHDLTARERKEILEVLQATADETRDNIDDMVRELQENAERGDIIAYGWLHTRSAIKMQKNLNGWTGTLDPNATDVKEALIDSTGANPLVTQLDPDVITRQKRKLQPQDEYFERAIWLGCYELLRRGRSLAEIRDWCVERTEVWRAVSMSALPLSRELDERQSDTNSLALLLWRRTCYSLARQGGTDDYERAVYGILSGDVKTVSPVCGSWDDFVFTQCNALLRSQFDNYVLKRSAREATQSVTQLPVFDAIQSHGDAATISEAWLGSLETKPEISAEARTPIKSLQAAILSDTLDRYIYNEGLVLGSQANQNEASRLIPDFSKSKANVDADKYFSLTDQNGLRILVHVYLLLSSLEELEAGDSDADLRRSQENALAAYISTLRLNGLVELLPLYCSKLHGDRAFYALSRNVSKVVDTDERRTILRIMEQLGMDITEFVVFQPQSLMTEHPESLNGPASDGLKLLMDEPPSVRFGRRLIPDFLGETPDELDPVDERLVQSLEWMMLVDGLWDETFATGVAIYKRFLKTYNLQGALALSRRVPCSVIFRIKAGVEVDDDDTDLVWFNELAGSEDLADRQLITARNYLEMEALMRALDSMETVGASVDLQLDPTFERTPEFLPTLSGHVKFVKNFMSALTQGWLLESLDEDEDFQLLRDMYLPEVILGYISVLHYGGTALSRDHLLEAMELAALIADKDSDLASILMKSGRMKEVVEAFANCSKALAINSEDKRKGGSGSSKKLRELGWSRELWTVKQ